jgi:hypothetical protein
LSDLKILERVGAPRAARPELTRSEASVRRTDAVALPDRRGSLITDLVPASLRHDMIALAAYYRSAERDFAPGQELEDWLAAECEVDATLRARYAY